VLYSEFGIEVHIVSRAKAQSYSLRTTLRTLTHSQSFVAFAVERTILLKMDTLRNLQLQL